MRELNVVQRRMLPKSKGNNHIESSSLMNNLNSVNSMMINYNSSNSLNQSSKATGDERQGCRALICDSNGIIIGETAYRCMICSQINDSIAETKQHYYENHSNEILLGPTGNCSQNSVSSNGNNNSASNLITNSILSNSLNSSLNNGLQFTSNNNSYHQQSSSLLNNNNETMSAKKRKNFGEVIDKIYGNKNSKKSNSSTNSLIQSTGTGGLSNLNLSYLNVNNKKDLIAGLNSQLSSQLNSQLSSQLSNQLSSLNSLNNLTNFNNQLTNDDYDDPDDQQSDSEQDDWTRTGNISMNNLGSLSKDLLANPNNAAILEAINKSSLYLKLNENMTDNLSKELNSKSSKSSSKLNNLFADNSIDQNSYSNTTIYENMINLSNDSDNKDDLSRAPPAVKLKRGSTTANVGKPGHVSCAVCGVVRYYSCVYRRYGQFTCQVCYRFFRTFFAKPNQYTCTNLGSCPLDVRVRCRACWIQACINLYTVDGQRKQILDTYRPLNKASDDDTTLITDANNNSTNLDDDLNQTMKNDSDDELDERSLKKV